MIDRVEIKVPLEGLTTTTKLLIIGYGNSLRCDDGVGRQIAAAVETWQVPGVAARSIHQLVPELVEDLKHAAYVVFVDAAVNGAEILFRRIDAAPRESALNHTCTPSALLALCRSLYDRRPAAWLLTIPGMHFGMGEEVSSRAQRHSKEALALIRSLISHP